VSLSEFFCICAVLIFTDYLHMIFEILVNMWMGKNKNLSTNAYLYNAS